MNNLEALVINENGFSYNPFTGETYTLNETGISILELLRDGSDKIAAATILAKKHQMEFEDVFPDVLDFCEQLKLYGIA